MDKFNPPHYTYSKIETIEVIEAWGLGYRLGNVIKYISRAGRKGDRLEDLRKALWYLEREINEEDGKRDLETSQNPSPELDSRAEAWREALYAAFEKGRPGD